MDGGQYTIGLALSWNFCRLIGFTCPAITHASADTDTRYEFL